MRAYFKVIMAILTLLLLTAPIIASGIDTSEPVPEPETRDDGLKKWTFIIYLFADSSQHGGTLKSYYEMVENLETKGGHSDETMNVLVLIDRHKHHAPDGDGNSHAYYVKEGKGNSEEIALSNIDPEWLYELNMGSRHTLIKFGEYAIQNYPAEHYCVITRSAGWWPDNFGEDEQAGDNLNPFEMRSVMIALSNAAGKKIDILNIAGCTSGMFEWAYDYYPYVDYYVSTETYSIGSYWRIFYWLDALKANPTMSVGDFTKIIVDEYFNDGRSNWNEYNSITASSTDLRKIRATSDALNNMSLALMDTMRSDIHSLRMARDATIEIDNYLRVDIVQIAYQVALHFPEDSQVHKHAQEVIRLAREQTTYARNYTGIEGAGINVSTAESLSVFFVRDGAVHFANAVEGYRSRLHFCLENHWLAMLDDFFSYYHIDDRFSVGELDIQLGATQADLEGDGWNDDLWVEVVTDQDDPIQGAEIYLNGDFLGQTNDEGWLAAFNLEQGDYTITAIYGEYADSVQTYVEGYGAGFQLFLNLFPGDWDGDGWNDDVVVQILNDQGEPVPGALIHTEVGMYGWTDEWGQFRGYDFPEGPHLIFAVVWEQFWIVNMFYSEGGESGRIAVDVDIMDYSNDGDTDDLDIYVQDKLGDWVSGAIVYIDDEYLGETADGRMMDQNYDDGWYGIDVYYKPQEEEKEAYFKDVYLRIVDLDGDGFEETLSAFFDVELEDPAMEVHVTEQVHRWEDTLLRGVLYDNFTAVRDHVEYRVLNYTTDHTRFINITLTLMDENGFIKDRWTLTGLWLELPYNYKPKASLFVRPTYTYVGDVVTFNGSNSADEDGNITGYFFDFGDGTNTGWTNKSIVTHVYSEPGNYSANLMVMDNLGIIDDKSNSVTLWVRPVDESEPPTARLFVRPTYVYPWEEVYFNGSTSEDEDGIVEAFWFSFGDGTNSGWVNESTVVHVYNQPGNYTAYLKVKDDAGIIDDMSNKITIWVKEPEGNEAPKAYLYRRPYKVNVNETVLFNATSSEDDDGLVHRYFFDFGDGTDSGWIFEPVTTHMYTEPGYYSTRVMVEDDFGAVSEWSKEWGVEVVGNVAPRSYLFSRPHYADIGEEVVFNASGSTDEDGSVVSYYYDFGDGTYSGWTSEHTIAHTYDEPGDYTVQLWVKDDSGETNKFSSRTTITVKEAEEEETWPNMFATVIVVLLFIALMVAGTVYEVKKSRGKRMAEEDVDEEEPTKRPTKGRTKAGKVKRSMEEEEFDDEEDLDEDLADLEEEMEQEEEDIDEHLEDDPEMEDLDEDLDDDIEHDMEMDEEELEEELEEDMEENLPEDDIPDDDDDFIFDDAPKPKRKRRAR